ncbi:MAG: HAMP domain-containing protein, partial [Planctomycetes bacterium]|nr:HAMP domain-containing protein [Planctomycetota bacterium]
MTLRDPLHWVPVRYKLALMFLSVCMLAFGVGGTLVSRSAEGALEGEILRRMEFQSRAYATALDGHLKMLVSRSEDFASDGFIRDHAAKLQAAVTDGEAQQLRAELRRHLLVNKLPLVEDFTDLSILALDGRVLLAAREAPDEREAAELSEAASRGAARCSEWLPARAQGGLPRVAIATPLLDRDDGTRIGSLVTWVHPGVWIVGALRANELGEASAEGQVDLLLIDREGARLAVHSSLTEGDGPSHDSDLVRSGFGLDLLPPEEARETSGAHGGTDRHLFSRSFEVATNGWSVRVDRRAESLMTAVAGLQSRFLGVGMILAIGASLLLFFPMRFLARPLLQLASAARRIQGGDFSARVEVDSTDEIGVLGESFNAMAKAIEERTERLEESAAELRHGQRELRAERDRLNAVIASMRDGLVVLDASGKPVLWNRAAGPLLGQLEVGALRMQSHHACERRKLDEDSCLRCLLDVRSEPRSCVMEIAGGVYEVHSTRLSQEDGGRAGRVLVSRDLTDRIAQDERQIHQERLAVLGEVAAVVAHELNNPLAAISMYNQMLATDLGDDRELSESVDVIQRNVETCKRTIRELLDYATDVTPEIAPVSIADVLEDVSIFLRPLRERSGVELETDCPEEPILVSGDETQIRQVFVNLVVNAIQAMGPSGGRIEVSARLDGEHVVVDVADDGAGIPQGARDEIFRPFFTTKRRGEGTGLGLSTSRRIAEMYGGGLELISTGPTGTTFRVRLRARQ